MKRCLGLALIITAIALPGSAYLLLRGIVRFNYPSVSEFPVRGIDISHHQGQVHWSAVAADGIHFAYIKASEGESFRDQRFANNWSDAQRVGIIPGAYHFYSLCGSPELQAANFLAAAPPVVGAVLPPAVDLELGGNCAHRPTPESFRKDLALFLESVEAAWGRRATLYVTSEFYAYIEGHFPSNPLWVRSIFTRPRWAGFRSWVIWQYANRGHVQGVSTLVDLNVYSQSWASFRALTDTQQ
jgi:lysozyme